MRIRRILAVSFLLLAAFFLVTLPPRARHTASGPATPAAAPAIARGAYHIHTTRSDGSGTIDEVAAAAAKAGLRFIVLTDHGDGTRPPLAPAYKSGVLVIDAVEISTEGGHYAAIGFDAATPYRLAGETRDVVEDVHRFGGFGIAAHPTSRKPELRWSGWDDPIDGLEWLNVDSEWRDESTVALLLTLARYPVRPAEALASIFGHDREALDRWDRLAAARRTLGVAAVDAHARIGVAERGESYRGLSQLRLPSYEALFRTFSLQLELQERLTGDAAADAAAVIGAIRAGHLFTTLDAIAEPRAGDAGPAVRFEATSGETRARMGDFLPPQGAVAWRASTHAPEGATMRLVCDGKVAAERPASTLLRFEHAADAARPAACRLEVGWDRRGHRITWLVTNPIYLRGGDPAPAARAFAAPQEWWGSGAGPDDWNVEHDPQTKASVAWEPVPGGGGRMFLQYALPAGARAGRFAAAVTPRIEPAGRSMRLHLRAWADRPMRLSVQAREAEASGEGLRWRRSIYVDETPRDHTIAWDDFRPVSGTKPPHPSLDRLHALLLVVDTEHTPPGRTGWVRVADVRFER